ncbi:response regulator [Marivirga salinae]|uniref:Response regulator n=1 Tax=Marivirga salinarum TaxID=3059078 RepID=A0AA49GE25_9BACT|nr:response regulator [Marivirga sp. BDSF4-3]WKK76692.2 response regulator [Marivirga sp. BDSF4-3]
MEKELFIIDDDSIYRMIVSSMLEDILPELQITECDNGEIGLAKLKEVENSNKEIIVLLDINMPILNGWEFLEEIKNQNYYKLSTLKIYLVSSSTDESDISKSKQFNYLSGFYHKPLEIDDLRKILELN